MPVQGEGFTVLVWVSDDTGAGLDDAAGDLSLFVVRDGEATAATNEPVQVVAGDPPAGVPGWYTVAVEAAENDAGCVAVIGECAVPDSVVHAVVWFNTPPPERVLEASPPLTPGSVGARLRVLERWAVGAKTQDKSSGRTEVLDDDGETVIRRISYDEDATTRYQREEDQP